MRACTALAAIATGMLGVSAVSIAEQALRDAAPATDDRPAAMQAALRALATQPASTAPSTRPSDGGGFPFMPGFGPGGFGGPERKLVKEFDKDGDQRLNRAEREAARAMLKTERESRRRFNPFGPAPIDGGAASRPTSGPSVATSRPSSFDSNVVRGGGGGPGGFGGPFGRRGTRPPPEPGPRVSPGEVRAYPHAPLFEPSVVRTFFIEFEHADWEAELVDFYKTDVDIPATVAVDGKRFEQVGVNFRGTTSFNTVQDGYKRSLKLKLSEVKKKQDLYGFETINLNNATLDAGFLHSVLYSHIARRYMPAPRVNYAKVVINGEYWGVYVNTQQVDKDFLKDAYGSSKGVRWKIGGNRFSTAAFSYLGEEIEPYKQFYEMKTDDGEKAWKSLIAFCRILNQTPPEQLEATLKDVFDVESALWFLALENVLINTDGYWSKGSDLNLFRDKNGKFFLIAHDMNESFEPPGFGPMAFGRGSAPFGMPTTRPASGSARADGAASRPTTRPPGFPGGGGFRGGPEIRGVELDPLIGIDNHDKPLRSRLLAAPALRERYLRNVRTIAEEWLDWNRLGPIAGEFQALIDKDVERDTRKLFSYVEFKGALAPAERPDQGGGEPGATGPTTSRTDRPDRRQTISLREFAQKRREYLLNHPEIRKLVDTGPSRAAAAPAAPAAESPR